MDPINCMHVEPNGKTCRRVAYNRLYYCRAHRKLYPDAGPRKDAPPRPETGSEKDVRMREGAMAPDEEPPAEQQIAEETPPESPEEVPEVTDWDEVQKEDGWWDDALPDATPEELMKEALANAEAAERKPSAKEIYTISSLGGEVTEEMFDSSPINYILSPLGFAVFFVVLCLVLPLLAALLGIWVIIGAILEFEFYRVEIDAFLVWTYIAGAIFWNPVVIAASAIFGASVGFNDHWSRSKALNRGKADYLASQEYA
jgi:hypothetical protein